MKALKGLIDYRGMCQS